MTPPPPGPTPEPSPEPLPEPRDPFAGDPDDPARALDDDEVLEPLTPDARESVLSDLEDLEVFQALLEGRGVRGLVVDCRDCGIEHFFDWPLLRGNLRRLLDSGTAPAHEPPLSPDPQAYVSWDYARGFADAVLAGGDGSDDTPD